MYTTPTDSLYTSGRCSPNPGGEMRATAVLVRADGTRQHWEDTYAAAEGNAPLLAAYLAVGVALRRYTEEVGGAGPLTLYCDQDVLVKQILGECGANEKYARYRDRVQARIDAILGSVNVRWINGAELAARADLETPDTRIPPPADRTILGSLVAVPPKVAGLVASLNAHPKPTERLLRALTLGGSDALSEQAMMALQFRASREFGDRGAKAALIVAEAFPTRVAAQAAAMRWVLRGLAAELAVVKVGLEQPGRTQSGTLHARGVGEAVAS